LYLSINPEVLNKKGEGGSRARYSERYIAFCALISKFFSVL
jgi:hypothetical protein